MAKGRPLSAAHKAAISAGMKRYWATRSARSGGGGGSSHVTKTSQNIDNGGQISRAEAAARMFGTKAAAKKISKARKRR